MWLMLSTNIRKGQENFWVYRGPLQVPKHRSFLVTMCLRPSLPPVARLHRRRGCLMSQKSWACRPKSWTELSVIQLSPNIYIAHKLHDLMSMKFCIACNYSGISIHSFNKRICQWHSKDGLAVWAYSQGGPGQAISDAWPLRFSLKSFHPSSHKSSFKVLKNWVQPRETVAHILTWTHWVVPVFMVQHLKLQASSG